MSSHSKLHSGLHYSSENAGSFSESTEGLTPPTPPPPPLPPRLIDSPQPPPLPVRNYSGAGDEQRVPSPPPPLPERRYLDDNDEMGLTWVSDPVSQNSLKSAQYSEVAPRPKNRSLEDSFPPPPLPERTPLSEQLVSPGSSLTLTNDSERHHEKKAEALLGRYVVTDTGNRHLLLYDEDMAYAETVIEPQTHISTRSLPPEPSNAHTLQNLRMGMGMHSSEPQYDVARPPDTSPFPPPSPIYDEAVVPNSLRGLQRVPLNDLEDQDDVRYTVHGPGDFISKNRSAMLTQQVEPYEIVPLHSSESITGKMNSSHGSRTAQLDGRGPLSPPNEPAPPVPLDRSHSKDDTFVNGSSETKEYDTLHHNQTLKSLNVTLPRQPTSNATYSQLMLSEAELLQRASATSPVTSPTREAQPVTRPQKRHEYDVCNLNASGSGHSLDSTPSLIWDNSDLLPTSSLPPLPPHPTSPSKAVLSHRLVEEEPKLPSFSLTEEDLERREKRLEKHHYHDLDIRQWPATPDDVSPSHNQASEIKAVVRDSWNLASQKPDSLPKGWVREVNEQGQVFYWHIPTGRIQYTRPVASPQRTKTNSLSPPPVSTEPSPAPLDTSKSDITLKPKVSTFAATYCGSVDVEESSLVRGKCVKVVYQSIHTLSVPNPTGMKLIAGRNAGDVIYLQIQGMVIHWLDPETSNVIVSQPINRIRVWGIGQENDRDFGYVARNPTSHQHQCHVFRCDIAAKGVARALLDSHKENKVKGGVGGMMRAEEADQQHKPLSPQTSRDRSLSPDPIGESSVGGGAVLVKVPLQADERIRSMSSNSELTGDVSESYKRIEATYCGSVDVPGPHGMSLVNEATTKLSYNTKGWIEVFVDIAASHVKILERKNEQLLKEHRVRFLSFLGIASDDRFCGYITDNGDNVFQFHGFRCEPNSDRLCLSLHSACQSRFQRVLDAHMDDTEASVTSSSSSSSAQPLSFLERFGSKRRSKRKKDDEKDSEQAPQSFKVLFNGCEVALKAEGVDAVKKPVKNLTAASSFASSHSLVELTISNTGFTITDPQKIIFARKQISVKKITYCCRIKNHFTFIAKEGSKLMCYVFTESEDSIANVVSAVQKLMS